MGHEDARGWRRAGDGFVVDWAGAEWTFGIADGRAGLSRGGAAGRFLALVGLAAVGRRDVAAFTAGSLVGLDVVHGRLLATFEPAGWNGLTVRAGWGLSHDGRAMDLEIQATASSVGELRRLEVLVDPLPGFDGRADADPSWLVDPRDRHAAGSSYDGRESDEFAARLTTREVGRSRRFFLLDPPPVVDGVFAIAHPDDVARTIRSGVDAGRPLRHAFFGFDLEKGVVLRGRLRASIEGANTWRAEAERFLAEPPPLRTD